MKRNLRKKIAENMSSGKRGRAGIWALGSLGAATVVGVACALILSAVAADSEPRKAAALEAVEMDGSCETEIGGFLTTFHVEETGDLGLADKWGEEQLLFATAGEPNISVENGESEPKLDFTVVKVTGGEDYDTLINQFPAGTDVEVMEVTAKNGDTELSLSGCNVTMQVIPTKEWAKKYLEQKRFGMSVTVLPLDEDFTEPTVFINQRVDAGKSSPMTITYTVPKGKKTAMYAIGYSAVDTITLDGDEKWDGEWIDVPEGANWVIDLNGHKIVQETSRNKDDSDSPLPLNAWGTPNLSLFYVKGILTIKDGQGNGSIEANIAGDNDGENWHSSLVYVQPGGKLNIEGGMLKSTGKIASVIMADSQKDTVYTWWDNSIAAYAEESVEINISGGTISGGEGFWGGGGIFMSNGTLDISGGTITDNATTGSGGGILVSAGTLNISGGTITGNHTGDSGGGIYVEANSVVVIKKDGVISSNSARNGGGIYTSNSKITITGGTIKKNTAVEYGGGIYALESTIDMSGGTIGGALGSESTDSTNHITTIDENGEGNSAVDGGGIYVDDCQTISNGIKSNNIKIKGGQVSGNIAERNGGGVCAGWIELSAGTIKDNRAWVAGGGVYAISMKMTGGTISDNKVIKGKEINRDSNDNIEDYSPKGGGGICITRQKAENGITAIDNAVDYVCQFKDGGDIDGVDIKGNMSLTGGVIEGNESCHTGGGIFVDIGAVAYISGVDAKIYIQNNTALDKSPGGHGYAGGGVFVEHPNAEDPKGTAEQGGKAYIYNAVITQNTAKYGGGVAGCGTSNVTICSVNGVAVYGNKIESTNDARRKNSADLYVDGAGMVDSSMMGCAMAIWEGKYKEKPGTTVNPEDIQPSGDNLLTIADRVRTFEYGFYLHVKESSLTPDEKKEINSYATVVIQNNESKSGGGGVGGNGFMKLGLNSPEPATTYALELQKIVTGKEDSDNPPMFNFTVTLQGEVIGKENSYPWYKYDKESDEWLTQGELQADENGEIKLLLSLSNEDCIRIGGVDANGKVINGLPEGTKYTIKEEGYTGYAPSFEVKGDWVKDETKKDEVSGRILQNNFVVFTNTALYALPETGGETPAMYYLLGCALLVTAMAGGWMYKRRSNSVS